MTDWDDVNAAFDMFLDIAGGPKTTNKTEEKPKEEEEEVNLDLSEFDNLAGELSTLAETSSSNQGQSSSNIDDLFADDYEIENKTVVSPEFDDISKEIIAVLEEPIRTQSEENLVVEDNTTSNIPVSLPPSLPPPTDLPPPPSNFTEEQNFNLPPPSSLPPPTDLPPPPTDLPPTPQLPPSIPENLPPQNTPNIVPRQPIASPTPPTNLPPSTQPTLPTNLPPQNTPNIVPRQPIASPTPLTNLPPSTQPPIPQNLPPQNTPNIVPRQPIASPTPPTNLPPSTQPPIPQPVLPQKLPPQNTPNIVPRQPIASPTPPTNLPPQNPPNIVPRQPIESPTMSPLNIAPPSTPAPILGEAPTPTQRQPVFPVTLPPKQNTVLPNNNSPPTYQNYPLQTAPQIVPRQNMAHNSSIDVSTPVSPVGFSQTIPTNGMPPQTLPRQNSQTELPPVGRGRGTTPTGPPSLPRSVAPLKMPQNSSTFPPGVQQEDTSSSDYQIPKTKNDAIAMDQKKKKKAQGVLSRFFQSRPSQTELVKKGIIEDGNSPKESEVASPKRDRRKTIFHKKKK